MKSESVFDNIVKEALNGVGQVVLTGGSSGIGQVFINSIARVEPCLPICNLSRHQCGDFGGQLTHYECDFSQVTARAEVFKQLAVDLRQNPAKGRLLLINNSGFGSYGHFPAPDLPTQLGMIEVNVSAVVELTGILLPLLKERGGAILNVASTAAFQATPYMATYGATKAFLLSWTLGLNEELRGSGVSALAICPGPTRTGFQIRAGFGDEGFVAKGGQSAEEVVQVSLKALIRGKVIIVSGLRNRLLARLSIHSPKVFGARIAGRLIRGTRMD